jgi:hypothetical protein
MVMTCFGQYGHHQVLKYLVGETAAILLLLYMWTLRWACVLCVALFCCYCICVPSDGHVCFGWHYFAVTVYVSPQMGTYVLRGIILLLLYMWPLRWARVLCVALFCCYCICVPSDGHVCCAGRIMLQANLLSSPEICNSDRLN